MRSRAHEQGVRDLITPLEMWGMMDRKHVPTNSNIQRAANLQLILAQIEEEIRDIKKTPSFVR